MKQQMILTAAFLVTGTSAMALTSDDLARVYAGNVFGEANAVTELAQAGIDPANWLDAAVPGLRDRAANIFAVSDDDDDDLGDDDDDDDYESDDDGDDDGDDD